MKRRNVIKQVGLLAATALTGNMAVANEQDAKQPKPVLTIAHITDVHIRPEEEAPNRFKKCLRLVKQHKIDFVLNGGDSIHAADYNDITRARVNEQWNVWFDCMKELAGYEVYSCIGNHDPWWAAPDKTDAMYGKEYVVKQLNIPQRYYSFSKKGWHFIILDGNNPGIKLDDEQYQWLEQDIAALPSGTPVLLMSHFPVFGATPVLVGGNHSDNKKLKDLFYQHRNKVRVVLSGHNHLYDKVVYNNVWYCCNGAMSGFWWGKGDKESAGPGYYLETPPGYAILNLYADGAVTNEYYPHGQ
ncbi:MAG: metallophosphoesterase [Chitinophagaceae bacterium]|nr:metallophosphoesterase [Chitinophagaceae bacterium]